MPILEDMQASLLELHAKVDAISSSPTMAAEIAVVTPGVGVELDSEGKPWDERIHSATKNQTVKGVWKLRKGVDKALVAKVKAEVPATNNTAPPTPGGPTPSGPTPGTAVKQENHNKRMALEAINELTNNLGVEYDNIQATLINKFGVDSFDKLPETSFESAADEFSGWKDDLGDINDIANGIIEMGGENGSAGIATICEARGFTIVSQATLEAIPELVEALREYNQQWVDFVNSQ